MQSGSQSCIVAEPISLAKWMQITGAGKLDREKEPGVWGKKIHDERDAGINKEMIRPVDKREGKMK